jgi:hypothetical protein
MTYEQNVRDIEAALILGIRAKGDDNDHAGNITHGQVKWVAAWLASEGIGRLDSVPTDTLSGLQNELLQQAIDKTLKNIPKQPDVRPGQIWADNDPRSEGRTLQVLAIEEGRALCAVRTNSNWVQEWIDERNSKNPPSDRRGANTRINLKRFDGSGRGYKLVREEAE